MGEGDSNLRDVRYKNVSRCKRPLRTAEMQKVNSRLRREYES